MTDDPISIPAEFWDKKHMSLKQFMAIARRGYLNHAECLKLWAMLGRTDRPPDKLQVMLKAEDVMREFPPLQ